MDNMKYSLGKVEKSCRNLRVIWANPGHIFWVEFAPDVIGLTKARIKGTLQNLPIICFPHQYNIFGCDEQLKE